MKSERERARARERERARESERERERERAYGDEMRRLHANKQHSRQREGARKRNRKRSSNMHKNSSESAREKYMTSRNGVQASEQQDTLAPTVLFSLQTFGSALFLLVVAALPCVDGHTHLLSPASAVLVNTYIPT